MKMTVKEAAAGFAAGELKLVDVRTVAEFGAVHIEGAESMPLDRLDGERVRALGRCVLVCQSGKRAEQALEKLRGAGCDGLGVLEGGMNGWLAEGLPVVRGKGVMSLERQVRVVAGALVLAGVVLGFTVNAGFFGLSAFIGAGLVFAGLTDWCGMALLLAKAPWNRRAGGCAC